MSAPDPTPIPAPTIYDLKIDLREGLRLCDALVEEDEGFREFAANICGVIRRCFAAERDRDAAYLKGRKAQMERDCTVLESNFAEGGQARRDAVSRIRAAFAAEHGDTP